MENRISNADQIAPLDKTRLEAGSSKVHQVKTLYGKFIDALDRYSPSFVTLDKAQLDKLLKDCHYDMHDASLEGWNFDEDERQYIEFQCATASAKSGNYVPLMMFLSDRFLLDEYDPQHIEKYEDQPNPLEAESLILQMGERLYNGKTGDIDSICSLWRKVGLQESHPLESIFSDHLNKDNAGRLEKLRSMIYDVSIFTHVNKYSKKDSDLSKLMYFLLSFERAMTQEVRKDDERMSVLEKIVADEIRRGLRKT